MKTVGAIFTAVLIACALALPALAGDNNTCKDIGFPDNLESSTSGEWGNVAFDSNFADLTLVVYEGWEVTICVKAGSANQGNGPVNLGSFSGSNDYELSHPSGKQLSHYGLIIKKLPPPQATTTSTTPTTEPPNESTTTTVSNITETTSGDTSCSSTCSPPEEEGNTPPTTEIGEAVTLEQLPFTGANERGQVLLGLALLTTGFLTIGITSLVFTRRNRS